MICVYKETIGQHKFQFNVYVESDSIYLFKRISKQKYMLDNYGWKNSNAISILYALLLLLKETLLNTIKGNHHTLK